MKEEDENENPNLTKFERIDFQNLLKCWVMLYRKRERHERTRITTSEFLNLNFIGKEHGVVKLYSGRT